MIMIDLIAKKSLNRLDRFIGQRINTKNHVVLTCKRGSVGQSEGLSIPRSSSSIPSENPITQILMNLNFIDPQTRVLNYF